MLKNAWLTVISNELGITKSEADGVAVLLLSAAVYGCKFQDLSEVHDILDRIKKLLAQRKGEGDEDL